MAALHSKYLDELAEYMTSGELEEDFKWSSPERREEILEFLEKFMDVAEIADKTATELIFKGSMLSGLIPQDQKQDQA
jgi:hypothetical protein